MAIVQDSETIAFLQTKVAELKEELATTRLKAQADSQDAAAWRARSNATMPETSQELHNLQKRIAVKKLVETMRKELEVFIYPCSHTSFRPRQANNANAYRAYSTKSLPIQWLTRVSR